jgi:hypothetical protein
MTVLSSRWRPKTEDAGRCSSVSRYMVWRWHWQYWASSATPARRISYRAGAARLILVVNIIVATDCGEHIAGRNYFRE